MERRSGPNLEVVFEKHRMLVDAHPSFAVVHGIRWVGVNEHARGNKLRALDIGKLFGCCRRREHIGKDEESECNTETRAKHSAENEGRNAAPKFLHGSLSCVLVVSGGGGWGSFSGE